jgi:hypothetical protein
LPEELTLGVVLAGLLLVGSSANTFSGALAWCSAQPCRRAERAQAANKEEKQRGEWKNARTVHLQFSAGSGQTPIAGGRSTQASPRHLLPLNQMA